MAVLSAMRYCLGDPSKLTNLYLSFFFMPFGLFFDLFDGKVARWRKKSSLMGQELDSLADLVRTDPLRTVIQYTDQHTRYPSASLQHR